MAIMVYSFLIMGNAECRLYIINRSLNQNPALSDHRAPKQY